MNTSFVNTSSWTVVLISGPEILVRRSAGDEAIVVRLLAFTTPLFLSLKAFKFEGLLQKFS